MKLHMLDLGVLLILAGAVCPQVFGGEADAKALAKFDGNWELVSSTNDGKQADLTKIRGGVLVFDSGRMSAVEQQHPVGYGTIKVDPGKAPAELDWKYGDSPAKTGVSKGIYKFDGDKLTICTGELDPRNGQTKSRPSRFESQQGSGTTLLVYRRVERGIRLQDLHFPDYFIDPPSR